MHLKTFYANSMKDALHLIKKDLGKDAVILSTKKVKQPDGSFGLEIAAAVEHMATPPALTTSPTPRPLDVTALPQNGLAALLTQHGVPDIQQEPLVKAALGVKDAGFSEADALEMVLGKKVNFMPFGQQMPRGQVHVLIGPYGAGKTTLICKLALQLHGQGERVLLLSLDNEKLGGMAPLETVGNLIGRPVQLLTAETLIPDGMTVLVDTPGLNPHDGAALKHMQALLAEMNRPTRVHVVLPATLNGHDMPALPYAYRGLQPQSLIFTRLDECHRYGAMVNTMLNHPKLLVGMVTKSPDPAQAVQELDAASLAKLLTTPPTPLWHERQAAVA